MLRVISFLVQRLVEFRLPLPLVPRLQTLHFLLLTESVLELFGVPPQLALLWKLEVPEDLALFVGGLVRALEEGRLDAQQGGGLLGKVFVARPVFRGVRGRLELGLGRYEVVQVLVLAS